MKKILLPNELVQIKNEEELAEFLITFGKGSIWQNPQTREYFFCPSPYGVKFEGLKKIEDFLNIEDTIDEYAISITLLDFLENPKFPMNKYDAKISTEIKKMNKNKIEKIKENIKNEKYDADTETEKIWELWKKAEIYEMIINKYSLF